MKSLAFTAAALVCACSGRLGAAEAPGYFLMEDAATYVDAHGQRQLRSDAILQAKTAPDCRPSEQDPEGNWGYTSSGVQLGLRLEKKAFKAGENVAAHLYVRSVSESSVAYSVYSPVEVAFGITVLKTGDAQPIVRRAMAQATNAFQQRLALLVHSSKSFGLGPWRQRKHPVPLSGTHDLTRPGKYTVSGMIAFPRPDGGGEAQAASGTAEFEILPAEGGPAASGGSGAGLATNPVGFQPGRSGHSATSPETSGASRRSTGNAPADTQNGASIGGDSAKTTSQGSGPGRRIGVLILAVIMVPTILFLLRRRSR